ncbi:hypothetical protein N7U66_14500 [Lacinutrix neustonica]|uniref:Uncharacterized protein n=1 Tax=Lacinutrix neustonica TaxID=2980107 RepID=A0A9E8MTN5_9FLAO|nr:hypothetical protein [Lacinutrix neustonica]WAC01297.1 hypothetical protein N7U66_14500 [Lacinutrix neustonica]
MAEQLQAVSITGAGVTDDGNGMTYAFDPAAAGVGVHTLTYTFTDGNGCTNAASDDVEVFALPTVNYTALADLCIDAGVQAGLGGGTATGGVYSGTGVTDDGNGTTYSFDPAAAGVGVHTLTYTFTDGNGCTNAASDDVEVFALPTVTYTAPADLCIDAGVQAGYVADTSTLFGADNQGNYFSINITTGVATVLNEGFSGGCASGVTALGYDPLSGIGFGEETNGCGSGFMFDIATGNLLGVGSPNTGMPPYFQGVSVYNGVWYTVGVAGAPLSTFNPTTQVLTEVGPTGLGLSALAIDPNTGIAYATTGQGVTEIYTIDLSTGTPTLLADTGLGIG